MDSSAKCKICALKLPSIDCGFHVRIDPEEGVPQYISQDHSPTGKAKQLMYADAALRYPNKKPDTNVRGTHFMFLMRAK